MCVLAGNNLKAEAATALAPALAELKLLQDLNLYSTWRQFSALRVRLESSLCLATITHNNGPS
jgi:hypothetical protein